MRPLLREMRSWLRATIHDRKGVIGWFLIALTPAYEVIEFLHTLEWTTHKAVPAFVAPIIGWPLLTFGGMVLILDAVRREVRKREGEDERRRLAIPLTRSWLERELIAEAFTDADVHARAGECLHSLKDNGIFDQVTARKFFDDERAREELSLIYRDDLRRALPLDRILDCSGYCFWGPRLHRASEAEWPNVRSHLASTIRSMAEAGAA